MLFLQEAIALVASDAGDDYHAGSHRRYDYAVTYTPQMVTDVSRALLSRVPLPVQTPAQRRAPDASRAGGSAVSCT